MLDQTSRETIVSCVKPQMSNKRFQHVLRVERKAIELATRFHVDIAECQLAALLHDCAKEWSVADYEKAVERYQLPTDMLAYGSNILHGPVAACYAQEKFHISQDVKDAIYYHTIGHVQMSDVAKVLYIADYTEEGRDFTDVQTARKLAQRSLDDAIIFRLQQTVQFLAQKGKVIFPDMIVTYNHWMQQKNKD